MSKDNVLGDFLRARRELVRPGDADLPASTSTRSSSVPPASADLVVMRGAGGGVVCDPARLDRV
ncbi:hypothetical protein [Nonomuraea rosea]|uniref:hypothetical protein n=1 Tax=Nonomuraea rosea TaxID=638574 RepID=UPI0031E588DD